jgi:riboflavin biosynthesis pyrimidine reductase
VTGEPLLEPLLPPGRPAPAIDLLAALRPWEREHDDRPFVLCNMVATLDGRITIGGRSGPIGGPADHALFHGLRTVVDAVLVGTGTLHVERYGRLVRDEGRRARREQLGLDPDPIAVLITRTGTVAWDAPMFEAPEQEILIVTHPDAAAFPHVAAHVERLDLPAPTPAAALREIHRVRGLRSVLCEGGPTLNRGLLADGVLDELYVTVAPVLAGGDDALRILAGEPFDEPVRTRLAGVLRHDDELFLRYELTAG